MALNGIHACLYMYVLIYIYIYIYMYFIQIASVDSAVKRVPGGDNLVKDVQCYELFGGIALKNHAFSFLHLYKYVSIWYTCVDVYICILYIYIYVYYIYIYIW